MWALDPADPRTVGPYRLLARMATGGTATVYLGQSAGGRPVAVKTMHHDLAGNPEARARFRHEIVVTRAAAGQYSPALLDADPAAPTPWLVLEFLAAVSLREAVHLTGPLPPDSITWLAVGVAEALRAIHATGILHLDLNPANVLLTADGPRVVDFGLAALAGTDNPAPEALAGAPGFIAPEQVTGGPVGPATDLYALGATLVYASTGSRPDGVPALSDDTLRTVLHRCLSRDPAQRPDVTELLRLPAPVAATLPPALSAAIRHSATRAAHPPQPEEPGTAAGASPGTGPAPAVAPHRRRGLALALGLAATLVASGAVAAWLQVPGDRAAPAWRDAAPSTTSAATRRELTFRCTGNATVATMVYTVDGKPTTIRDLVLPWRQDIEVPPLPATTSWELRYSQPVGILSCEVLVDGRHLFSGGQSGTAGPGGVPTEPVHGHSGTG